MQAEDQPEPKRRGRPKGTGINDETYLHAIADGRLAAPDIRLRTLIGTLVAQSLATPGAVRSAQPESIVHRLVEKWRHEGPRYMEAAQARHRAQQMEAIVQGAVAIQRGVQDFAVRAAPYVHAAVSRFEAAFRSPEGQRALALIAKFHEAAQRDPFLAKVEAMKRDPRMAKWMTSPLSGGRLGR